MIQSELVFTGRELAMAGARLAENHAEASHLGWKSLADGYLLEFIAHHRGEFMVEDVREFAYKMGLQRPTSERSWAGVIMRAANLGLVRKVGYRAVTNPLAHATPATLWASI